MTTQQLTFCADLDVLLEILEQNRLKHSYARKIVDIAGSNSPHQLGARSAPSKYNNVDYVMLIFSQWLTIHHPAASRSKIDHGG